MIRDSQPVLPVAPIDMEATYINKTPTRNQQTTSLKRDINEFKKQIKASLTCECFYEVFVNFAIEQET